LRFRFVNVSLKLRSFRRYSLDNNIPKASTTLSSQRPRSILSEAGTQHRHSTTSSSSQTNTPPNAHPDSSAHGSPPHHVHHAGWMENLRDLSKLHWIHPAGSPPDAHHGATESEGVDEKGYHSTDTEAEAKRDVNTWRRDRKKRRRKAEIYVRLSAPSHYTALTQASRRLLDIFRPLSPGRHLF
jgi:hypothetical protein